MDAILRYFDLKRSVPRTREYGPAAAPPDPVWHYLPLSAGVAAGSFLSEYIAGRHLPLGWTEAWQEMILCLLLAFAIFPAVFRHGFDADGAFVVQLCAVFTLGIGWQSMFQAALRGAI